MGTRSQMSHGVRRYLLAMAVSFVVSILAMFILPFNDYSPQTPGRGVGVAIFFTTFSSVMFGDELIDRWRRNKNDTTE